MLTWLSIVVSSLGFFREANGAKSDGVFTIGGLFSPFTASGSIDEAQASALSGFIMAINEINSNPAVLPDKTIRFVIRNPIGIVNATIAGIDLSTQFNVDGVIGGCPDRETEFSNQILSNFGKIQVSSVARSAKLSVGKDFPFKARVVPSRTFDGMMLQNLVLYRLGLKRVVTFTTDDFANTNSALDFNDHSFAVPVFLGEYVLKAGLSVTDFSPEILSAKKTGATVFVLFVDPKTAGLLLEQAFKHGLFNEGTIVFLGEEATTSAVYHQHMSADTNVAHVMKGVFGIRFDLEYRFRHSVEGSKFIAAWRQQTPTETVSTCSSATDMEGKSVYISQSGECAGYGFTSFAADGSDIRSQAAYAYDATKVLLLAADAAYKQSPVSTSADIYHAVLRTNYTGASGLISFEQGHLLVDGEIRTTTTDGEESGNYDMFARGDRESGYYVKVLNFNEESYLSDRVNGGFVVVGAFAVEEDDSKFFQFCDSRVPQVGRPEFTCSGAASYRSSSNELPMDSKHTENREQEPSDIAVAISLTAIGLATLLITAVAVSVNRANPLLKAVKPTMILIVLFGLLMALIRGVLIVFIVSDDLCRAEIILAHLSIFVVLSTVLVKTWRVHRLICLNTLKKVTITNWDAIKLIAKVVLCLCTLLAVDVAVGGSRVVHSHEYVANQRINFHYCAATIPELQIGLWVVDAILLLMTAQYAWSVRSVPGALNEAYSILGAIAFVAATATALFITGAIKTSNMLDSIMLRKFLAAVGFSLCGIAIPVILYGNRILNVLRGSKVSDDLQVHDNAAGALERNKLKKASKDALKVFESTEAKAALCTEQISFWHGQLQAIGDGFVSDASNGLGPVNQKSSSLKPSGRRSAAVGGRYELGRQSVENATTAAAAKISAGGIVEEGG